jgi:hypothetical protein
MAKNKTRRGKKNGKATKGKPPVPRSPSLDPYAALLLDPCNAELSGGHFPGVKGILTRFTRTYTQPLGASTTAAFCSFFPGNDMINNQSVATSSTNFTNQYTTNNAPGDALLTTTAGKYRPVAACMRVWSDQPALNVTGNVAFGVLPARTIQSGTPNTADGLTSLLPNQTKLTSDVIEVKWMPGAADQFYHQKVDTSSMSIDADDRNAIIAVFTGLPVNSSFTVRYTWVVEWVPKIALDLVTNSADSGGSAHKAYEIVKALHHHDPMWNVSVKPFAQAFGSTLAPFLKRGAQYLGQRAGQASAAFIYNTARTLPLLAM